MAKWNFIVSGNQLIKELVVTDNDTDPRLESFMQPSFDLQGGKIVMKESGQYKTAIYFSQIGTIGGETPTDIEDAYDKLIALVANFNGAGATAQYKFLFSQTGFDTNPQTATSGTLTQGVTYEIVAFETGDDFIPSGAPNNDVGTKFIANGVAPTWGNGSEIGWDDSNLRVTPLGNNLYDITWRWYGFGSFLGTKTGAFPIDKTFIPYNGIDGGLNSGGGSSSYYLYRVDDDTIQLGTTDNSLDAFVYAPFAIEVYL